MRLWLLALCCAALTWSSAARADIERYAVIVSSDTGHRSEERLRYASADARKVYDTLRDLGDFAPMHMVLLTNETAQTFRSTLIALNDRIRASVANPNTQVVLFVYYSGHADSSALHLGETDLAISELSQLVRGSAATFRLLVLDACRSGALTRVKGGRLTSPFDLRARTSQLSGSGLAFITASSASEDAQESDELQGSLFTHAFVSGLTGAADRDSDGSVALDEAYRYAYDATLRLTSRTRAGVQHPTFHYDYRGHGKLVLTRPRWALDRRGLLHLPDKHGFLVMREDAGGAVVAELGERDASRTLALPPGRYFVLGRAPDHILEATIDLRAGESSGLRLASFKRVAYGRLVRKGLSDATTSHNLEAGMRARTALPNAERPCIGGFVGYGIDLSELSILARLGACHSGFENSRLDASNDEFDAQARLLRAWDLPRLTLHVGAGAGAGVFFQRFETAGHAPSRTTPALSFHVAGGASFDLTARWFAAVDLEAQTYVFDLRSNTTRSDALTAAFALRTSLGLGLRL